MSKPWKIAAVALFTLALLFGGLFGERLLAVTTEVRSTLQVFTEMVSVVQDSYAGEVSNRELVYSSIQGMLRTLDPHTSFLSREAYSEMRERQQSSFYGLGILVGIRNGALTVITPLEGTPAHRLGIRAGDVISEIEGEPTDALTLTEAVRRLKGPRGTSVNIAIVRVGLDEPLDLEVVRDEIPQDSVRYAYMVTPEVGYIMLSDFSRATGQEVADAITRLKQEGMQGLLLDLRGNGGGLLDQAIAVADQFLPEGTKIVETRGRIRDSYHEYFSAGKYEQVDLPVIVLVSGATASAAEILAGAIQDHDVGLVVGTPTWGKGLVQTVYSLGYGSGLALTTAKYYTPSGRLIQRDYTSWYDYYDHVDTEELLAGEEVPEREAFTTDLGRRVYGGGGITPDVTVTGTRVPVFFDYLQSRNAFFNFAVEHNSTDAPEDPSWAPDETLLPTFRAWVIEQGMATAEQFDEALEAEGTREQVRRQLRAEILGSEFGLEARHRVLARADEQIQNALDLFDEAEELLAQRLQLEETAAEDVRGGMMLQ